MPGMKYSVMLQALGAVVYRLLPHLKPVAFYSCKLNDAEQRSAPGEQDLLAVVYYGR